MRAIRRLSFTVTALLCYAIVFSQTVHGAKRAHCALATRAPQHLRLPLALPQPQTVISSQVNAARPPARSHHAVLRPGWLFEATRSESVLSAKLWPALTRPQRCEQDPRFARRV